MGRPTTKDAMPTKVRQIYEAVDPWAELVKALLQFAIGATLAVLVVLRGLNYLGASFPVTQENPLEIVGYGLMVSAGVELAYMLFTEGPDEAVDPLILGLSSAALITASKLTLGYQDAAIIAVLCAAIAALFYVKQKHLSPDRQRS